SLYINGALSASIAATVSPDYVRGWIPTMGANSGDYALDRYSGMLDDIRIYNRALSTSEVQQLYINEIPEPSVTVLLVCGIGMCAWGLQARRGQSNAHNKL
ncbi:MAG: LamG-like jellyroll fold domain-containing protein, partial [Terrimicrobiaceae bacterium]